MTTILFLYVVGYLIGIGAEAERGAFNQHPWLVIVLVDLFIWPIVIGKAIASRT